jgi:hypothetical protein
MKQLSFLFFALALSLAHADTNVFAVLTTADGISYTNAHIDHVTPIYANICYDGGIVQVALTNLPEPLRQQYLYDADKASQWLAVKKQKQQEQRAAEQARAVAEQTRLETLAKNAGWINIIGTDGKTSRPQYTAIINGTATKIYLNNPPKGLDAEVGYYSMKRLQAESDFVNSTLHGDRFNEWVAVQNGKTAVEEWMPRVRAFDTGTKDSGIPIWQFVAKND